MFIERLVNLPILLDKKSHFLFGPRQTGKTSLIRKQLPNVLAFNLLESDTFSELSARPAILRERIGGPIPVVIDEIQKLPELLDEVQWLIEERGARFLLTGSSARKMKRSSTNLLGGRARSRRLLPLSSKELGDKFELARALNHGLLPSIYFSDEPTEDLKSYVGDYLQHEIAAEAAVRQLPTYARFLHTVSFFNARQVNFERLASDAQAAPSTVRNYFQILQDTLLGSVLPAWRRGGQTREVATGKFYFFDTGVARSLQGRKNFAPGTPEWGEAFEAFIFHELRCFLEYQQREGTLHYWRTHTGHEVDFILNEEVAIEVKSGTTITAADLRGLRALAEQYRMRRLLIISCDRMPRTLNDIEVLPWREFLLRLWNGDICSTA